MIPVPHLLLTTKKAITFRPSVQVYAPATVELSTGDLYADGGTKAVQRFISASPTATSKSKSVRCLLRMGIMDAVYTWI